MHNADLIHDNPELQEKLEKIYQLRRTRSKVNWDRENYLELLEALGNPQHHLPPIIHVAGTNGKGSVVAMLRSILEAAGYSVHAYTSPHLLRVNERIYLAGQNIVDDELERRIDEVLHLSDDAPLSFFEIITALAFKAFAQKPADILLLEVGMGGRLDCTNMVDKPLLSIINRISLDHTDFLGDSLEQIAAEKAGIIKDNVPCVVGCQGKNKNRVYRVLDKEAREKGAQILACGRGWKIKKSADAQMRFSFQMGEMDLPIPSLQGVHQIDNAGVALMALEVIKKKFPVTDEHIKKGLACIDWPARLQQLPQGAFDLPQGTEVWLDSGHNDSAGEALAAQVQRWQELDRRPLHLVFGMLRTKDARRFLTPLLPHVASLNIVPIESEDSCLSVAALENIISGIRSQAGINAYKSSQEAIEALQKKSDGPMRILIAGSIYLAGCILKDISSE